MCKISNYFFTIIGCLISTVFSQSLHLENIREVFVDQLIQQFGNGSIISDEDIRLYYENNRWTLFSDTELSDCTIINSEGKHEIEKTCLLQKVRFDVTCIMPYVISYLFILTRATLNR